MQACQMLIHIVIKAVRIMLFHIFPKSLLMHKIFYVRLGFYQAQDLNAFVYKSQVKLNL